MGCSRRLPKRAPVYLQFVFNAFALSTFVFIVSAHDAAAQRSRAGTTDWPSLQAFYSRIQKLEEAHPSIIHVEKIGVSTSLALPLYAIKLSDNASQEEDESAILFSALHHAREPLGALLCMEMLERFSQAYDSDTAIKKLVDELEIWVVPIVNPDGYDYMSRNDLDFPWWRKNLRDNDGDGIFNPIFDGVDLNRNYDYNWREGGEDNPASWFFRGGKPFSENEIQAVKNLALRENIVAGLSFHSYGEVVLFPWGNYLPPPDRALIQNVGKRLASRMRKLSGMSSYGVLPLNGRVGQSSVWMYGRLRAIDYIVELADAYFTRAQDTRTVMREGMRGVRHFLGRALGAGLYGHVLDESTHQPVLAEILVTGYEARHVSPRMSETRYGRFERWLEPGVYTVVFQADGYMQSVWKEVLVGAKGRTELEVYLKKIPSHVPLGNNE